MTTALLLLVVATIVPAILLAAFGGRLFKEQPVRTPVVHARSHVVKVDRRGGQQHAHEKTLA